jgi:NAD(P)-dependent dehydrogenase (short-subunit alcohol dehydrogenase family)
MTKKKTAIVTGSTAGIGRAIALMLARLGYHVIINGRRGADEAAGFVEELKSTSGKCVYVKGDIAKKETREMIMEAIRKEGGLDVLVNNAGRSTSGRKDILSLEEQDILDVFQVNLIGPMLLSSALVPLMKKRDGRSYIINIASISSYTVSTNRADY